MLPKSEVQNGVYRNHYVIDVIVNEYLQIGNMKAQGSKWVGVFARCMVYTILVLGREATYLVNSDKF